jgi:hypothetical protein
MLNAEVGDQSPQKHGMPKPKVVPVHFQAQQASVAADMPAETAAVVVQGG